MRKITWRVGRPGICEDGKAIMQNFKICPGIKALLAEYCSENKVLPSVIINAAIKKFIMENKNEV